MTSNKSLAIGLAMSCWAAGWMAPLAAYCGAAAEEFAFPMLMDTGGQSLDGREHRYTVTFPPGELPPVTAYWTLSMYSLPEQRRVDNSIGRYSIDSRRLPKMSRNADGGLTMYIQKDPPGGDKNANWLPAQDGQFMMILRLYRPEQAVLDAAWEAPGVVRVGLAQ